MHHYCNRSIGRGITWGWRRGQVIMGWLWSEEGAGVLIVSWSEISVCASICDVVILQCRVQKLWRGGK
jgi:hypothetical protein